MADAMTIFLPVNDYSERDIAKCFEVLYIDWLVVERKFQAWGLLLCIGKRLRVGVTFSYIESGKTARIAGRGATAMHYPLSR